MSVIKRWAILVSVQMLLAAAIGFFLDPVGGSPGDFAVVVLYALVMGVSVASQVGHEEGLEPLHRALRRGRDARQGR